MPFDDASFDGAYSMNVSMNIADKRALYREIRRVLKPGAWLVLSEAAQGPGGAPDYPTPWARTAASSFLATEAETRASLEACGFAIESLREESGPAIQAGLNVSTVAQRFSGEDLGSIQDLRDLYRDVVLDCEEINDAFQRIVKGHPGRTFDEAVGFLLNALGADLAAASQSVSRTRLKQIVNDMHQLKSLNSVHQQCKELMLRAQRNHGADAGPLAPRNLMSELLGAQGRAWQGADAFSGLPEKLGVQSQEGAIYLLQGFKELVRSMPLKAFGDDLSQRDRVMISVQQALDLAIDNEVVDQ